MSERRLGIVKKISLKGLSEGWGDECYALTSATTYGQLLEMRSLNTSDMSEDEVTASIVNFVRSHIVGGKVMIFEEGDAPVLSDMHASDVEQMTIEMLLHIFSAMTGVEEKYADPKVSKMNAD